MVINLGSVGVNTSTPSQTLQVLGTLNVSASTSRASDLFVSSNSKVGIGTTTPGNTLTINGTTNAIAIDPSANPNPVINTTGNNMTISSASGSVIIRLGKEFGLFFKNN